MATAPTASAASWWPAAAVLAACGLWALDNNFTRKVALADASWVACVKGSVAGTTNLLLAFALGASVPAWPLTLAAMAVGLLAYGVSLTLFVVGLRHLGASRAGAYFSVAPFVGAMVAVLLLGEPLSWPLAAAAVLMALGVWLHLTEQHGHMHDHAALEHEHAHTHDAHHQHAHDPASGDVAPQRHTHRHQHTPLQHSHAHFPDAHHRHRHDD
jgi:drug/metabolite transporter (DMT)-like permease